MKKNKRLFPVTEEVFNRKILPVIEGNYIRKGRPPEVSRYRAFCGILYILRNGCPQRDLPAVYGHRHVIYGRFSRGNGRGLWAKVLSVLEKEKGVADAGVLIGSTTVEVTGTGTVKKGAAEQRNIAGGDTAKFHAAITGDGRLAEGFLSGGQVADVTVAARLTEDIAGCTVIADRGYDSDAFRRELRENNNIPVIPGRKNRKKEIVYDKRIYRKRGLIERIFGKLKENRRPALRYEKSGLNFLGFIIIAFIKILLC
jgi:transposase